MKQTLAFLLAAVVAIVIVGAAVVQAQDKALVDIGFSFMAGGKAQPAGKYSVEVAPGHVTLAGPKGTTMLPVITRLGRHDNDRDPEFVFDKVNGQLLLSEVWLAGADGYLLLGTKENHEHYVVGGSHPSK